MNGYGEVIGLISMFFLDTAVSHPPPPPPLTEAAGGKIDRPLRASASSSPSSCLGGRTEIRRVGGGQPRTPPHKVPLKTDVCGCYASRFNVQILWLC